MLKNVYVQHDLLRIHCFSFAINTLSAQSALLTKGPSEMNKRTNDGRKVKTEG